MRSVICFCALAAMVACAFAFEKNHGDIYELKKQMPFAGMQLTFQLLRSAPVISELQLTAAQSASISSAAQVHDRHTTSVLRKSTDQNAERNTVQAGPDDADVEGRKILERTLTAKQVARLSEIVCQRIGLQLFDDEGTVAYFQLSADQLSDIQRLLQHYSNVSQSLLSQTGFDEPQTVNAEYIAKYREYLSAEQKEKEKAIKVILSTMNKEQVDKYNTLVGKPFDTILIDIDFLSQ